MERKRAPKGGVEARLLLRLPREMAEQAKEAARREGISISEWWRRAGELGLRQTERGRDA